MTELPQGSTFLAVPLCEACRHEGRSVSAAVKVLPLGWMCLLHEQRWEEISEWVSTHDRHLPAMVHVASLPEMLEPAARTFGTMLNEWRQT